MQATCQIHAACNSTLVDDCERQVRCRNATDLRSQLRCSGEPPLYAAALTCASLHGLDVNSRRLSPPPEQVAAGPAALCRE